MGLIFCWYISMNCHFFSIVCKRNISVGSRHIHWNRFNQQKKCVWILFNVKSALNWCWNNYRWMFTVISIEWNFYMIQYFLVHIDHWIELLKDNKVALTFSCLYVVESSFSSKVQIENYKWNFYSYLIQNYYLKTIEMMTFLIWMNEQVIWFLYKNKWSWIPTMFRFSSK